MLSSDLSSLVRGKTKISSQRSRSNVSVKGQIITSRLKTNLQSKVQRVGVKKQKSNVNIVSLIQIKSLLSFVKYTM